MFLGSITTKPERVMVSSSNHAHAVPPFDALRVTPPNYAYKSVFNT
jgi:hypothetical protein